MLVAGTLGASAFVGVTDVAALDEDRWAVGAPEHGEVGSFSSLPVPNFQFAKQAEVDVGGKPFPLFSEIIGFDAVVTVVGVGIEVNAYHNGIFIPVGDGTTIFEVEKSIGSPSHGDGDSFGLEEFFYSECNLKCEVFLINAAPVCAFVLSPVAGINDDARDVTSLGLPASG